MSWMACFQSRIFSAGMYYQSGNKCHLYNLPGNINLFSSDIRFGKWKPGSRWPAPKGPNWLREILRLTQLLADSEKPASLFTEFSGYLIEAAGQASNLGGKGADGFLAPELQPLFSKCNKLVGKSSFRVFSIPWVYSKSAEVQRKLGLPNG